MGAGASCFGDDEAGSESGASRKGLTSRRRRRSSSLSDSESSSTISGSESDSDGDSRSSESDGSDDEPSFRAGGGTKTTNPLTHKKDERQSQQEGRGKGAEPAPEPRAGAGSGSGIEEAILQHEDRPVKDLFDLVRLDDGRVQLVLKPGVDRQILLLQQHVADHRKLGDGSASPANTEDTFALTRAFSPDPDAMEASGKHPAVSPPPPRGPLKRQATLTNISSRLNAARDEDGRFVRRRPGDRPGTAGSRPSESSHEPEDMDPYIEVTLRDAESLCRVALDNTDDVQEARRALGRDPLRAEEDMDLQLDDLKAKHAEAMKTEKLRFDEMEALTRKSAIQEKLGELEILTTNMSPAKKRASMAQNSALRQELEAKGKALAEQRLVELRQSFALQSESAARARSVEYSNKKHELQNNIAQVTWDAETAVATSEAHTCFDEEMNAIENTVRAMTTELLHLAAGRAADLGQTVPPDWEPPLDIERIGRIVQAVLAARHKRETAALSDRQHRHRLTRLEALEDANLEQCRAAKSVVQHQFNAEQAATSRGTMRPQTGFSRGGATPGARPGTSSGMRSLHSFRVEPPQTGSLAERVESVDRMYREQLSFGKKAEEETLAVLFSTQSLHLRRRQLEEVIFALDAFAPELTVQIRLLERNLKELNTMCEFQEQLEAKRREEVARLEEELEQTRVESEAKTKAAMEAIDQRHKQYMDLLDDEDDADAGDVAFFNDGALMDIGNRPMTAAAGAGGGGGAKGAKRAQQALTDFQSVRKRIDAVRGTERRRQKEILKEKLERRRQRKKREQHKQLEDHLATEAKKHGSELSEIASTVRKGLNTTLVTMRSVRRLKHMVKSMGAPVPKGTPKKKRGSMYIQSVLDGAAVDLRPQLAEAEDALSPVREGEDSDGEDTGPVEM